MSGFESSRFHYHRLRHELSNYALVRLRGCDGIIASMHQSGTHWLKFMLATAMADHYGIPGPQYNHANDIIGGPKDDIHYSNLPEIRASHTIPPLLLRNKLGVKLLNLPPSVILIRDIRASLVSNFTKWRERYAVLFSEYLRGDPSGRRFNSDLWWAFRFLNAWTQLAEESQAQVRFIHYEQLLSNPHETLLSVSNHLGLPLSNASINIGIDSASKEAMTKRSDPGRPPGEVNSLEIDAQALFTIEDRDFLTSRCEAFLDNALGYDYASWE
jgi:hypothetical protein